MNNYGYIGKKILEHLADFKGFGRHAAVPHDILFQRIKLYDPDMTDREFRQTYSELPICSCERGLYIPIEKQDLIAFREYMKGKAIPLFDRVKKVWAAYPELNPDDSLQLDLDLK